LRPIGKYGVPPKRGIILAGEPGTGKTIVCKALMSEADKITCIATTADGMVMGGYIPELFSVAQALSPSIIFIEDIDFIGQERHDSYRGTPPLISLLAEMDGIAEKNAIVTVATSNSFETLDKALSERPSRFDRVFRITRPAYQQRDELVKHISMKILCPKMSGNILWKRPMVLLPRKFRKFYMAWLLLTPQWEKTSCNLTGETSTPLLPC